MRLSELLNPNAISLKLEGRTKREVLVELGRTEEGLVIVEEGLKADDRVIVSGLQRARPGAKVTPRESQESMEALGKRTAQPARASPPATKSGSPSEKR